MLDWCIHNPAGVRSKRNCTPLEDMRMLGSTDKENSTGIDRESSRGTVGNSIHSDTWFYTTLNQPSAPKLSVL